MASSVPPLLPPQALCNDNDDHKDDDGLIGNTDWVYEQGRRLGSFVPANVTIDWVHELGHRLGSFVPANVTIDCVHEQGHRLGSFVSANVTIISIFRAAIFFK